ncbi:NADH (or F420H2) dehydrogenase subunit C [Flammeovirgaceae bacterium 311]|nr:NADH (or F420H2) dehydrogenase subunit C [Flammeovirgaceae bacterium 311]
MSTSTSYADLVKLLQDQFGQAVVLGTDENGMPPAVLIAPDAIDVVCRFLYEGEQTYFDLLSCITGVDNGPEAGTMEVVYNLYSIPYHLHLMLKVVVPRNGPGKALPVVPSVSSIWRTADWHEREIYDLVGIHFTGHPDLRRILLPADWVGHPLRRDYREQEYYHGIWVRYGQERLGDGAGEKQ